MVTCIKTPSNTLLQVSGTDSSEIDSPSSGNMFLIKPTKDFASFRAYVAHLNKLIRHNLPFLKAKFGLTTLSIQIVLTNSAILSDSMKKKLFDTKLGQAAVLV